MLAESRRRGSTWTTPLPCSSARESASRSARSFAGADDELGDRQLDRVLLEAVEPRPAIGRKQSRRRRAAAAKPLPRRPFREIGVVALARDDERREQHDAPPAKSRKSCAAMLSSVCGAIGVVVIRAVLRAELHVEQPQEVVDLGQRRDRALAAAAARALLDRDRRRDAEDRVDVRARRGLHELARVGVQRFEIAALPFGEQDVERERALAAAGHAGDDGEAVARDRDVDALQVVLARVVDADRLAHRRRQPTHRLARAVALRTATATPRTLSAQRPYATLRRRSSRRPCRRRRPRRPRRRLRGRGR